MRNAVTTEKEEVVSLMPDATSISSVRDRRWWILGVVGLAQLMVVLDATIVNIALPSAQRALGFSNTDRQCRRQPGQQRGEPESGEPDLEGSAPANRVRYPPPEQQQAGEAHGVGGHHPLSLGVAESQRPLG